MRIINFIIIGSLIFLFTNCKKKDTPVENIISLQMQVGSYWNYQVYDSLLNKFDTVSINVVADTIVNEKSILLWQFSKNNISIDSLFVLNTSDSACFYKNSSLTNLLWKFELPIVVGKTWSIDVNDNYKVVTKEKVYVYSNSFKISRDLQSFNYFINENIWIADNIGIVKMNINESNLAPVKKQTWRLLSYHINL